MRDGLNRTPAPAPRSVLTSRKTCCAHGMRSARLPNGNDIARTMRGADLPCRIPLKDERCSARLFESRGLPACTRAPCTRYTRHTCTSGRGRGSPGVSPSSVHVVVEGTYIARVMIYTLVTSRLCCCVCSCIRNYFFAAPLLSPPFSEKRAPPRRPWWCSAHRVVRSPPCRNGLGQPRHPVETLHAGPLERAVLEDLGGVVHRAVRPDRATGEVPIKRGPH